MLFEPAQPWMVPMFCPTRLGSGMPATTSTYTVRVAGHEVPAAGVVPATVPTATPSAATFCGVSLTVSPALRSAAMAPCRFCPVTGGTVIIFGPAETVSTIVAPCTARPDGDMLITSPLARALSVTWGPRCTSNPAWCSSRVAAVSVIPSTDGTGVYRPDVSHQPPSTSPSTTTSAPTRYASRLVNSHRCRNGSWPPKVTSPSYGAPSYTGPCPYPAATAS